MSNPTRERHARLLGNGRNQAGHYAQVRVALEKMDRPLDRNDLSIAARARALGLTLVTDSIGKFSPVPGFLVENWRIAHA